VLSGRLRGLALPPRGGVTFLPELSIGCTVDVVNLWPATCSLIW
jgi:hypothetical protein